MSQETLMQSLSSAEDAVSLHLNAKKESPWVNKVRRFLRHPYRAVQLFAFKRGLTAGSEAKTHAFFGSTLTLPLSDVNAADIFYAGCLRPAEGYVTRFLIKTLTKDDVFYDVGANYGFYSALALSLGATVHAFEPSAHCMHFLKMNADVSRGRSTLNHIALSDTKGTVDFFDTSSGHKSGMSTINETIAQSNRMAYTKYTVPTITLDSYVENHTAPTVIKIDIEGAEAKMLNGSRRTLQMHAPTLIVELWESTAGIENSRATLTLLEELGYRPYGITPRGDIHPVEINLGTIGENNNFVFIKS